MKKNYFIIVVILFFTTVLFAQEQPEKRVDWTRMSNNPNATFYEVVDDFNNYWKDKTPEKGKGYKVFKRWEAEMAPKVFPSGNLTLPQTAYQNYIDWQKTQSLNKSSTESTSTTGNWTALGPVGSPSGPSPYSRTGAGRLTFLRFDPTNAATMYVGAADGGLWKSTNSGASWTTNTDFLAVIGCSDLCINPSNTQIMYLATGDIEGNKNSLGVLKSTDGGATWNTTSLVFSITTRNRISKMIMDPTNPLIMIAVTNGGIFKTIDGWVTNTQTLASGSFKDVEFKPGDSNIVYAAGTKFFKSTDKGSTWIQITEGLPTSGVSRIALGVTAGNSAYVYALIGRSSDQGFLGMYRSTDSGTTFTTKATTPNLLGYETNGLDVGGQAFYDLAVVVSETDPEKVTTGGVNHWQSTDGGTNWTNLSYWASGQVHADIHDLVYSPDGTKIYSCNDGGIHWTSNGTAWTDISNNLNISQLVGLGNSADDATKITIGTQDNGTSFKSGSSWANIRGGDGGETFIDPTDNNTVYTQYVYGAFSRQTVSPASSTTITTGLPTPLKEYFDFYSPWKMDPVNTSRLYAGGAEILYTSANKGTNWTAIGTPTGSGRIKGLAIAPSNTTYIYCIKSNAISVSTDSGATFTDKTGTLPVGSASLSNLCVSNTNPLKVWVTFSGYSAGNKVFRTVDGGTTWTNVSTGLPNIAMNTIVYTNNSNNDAVYVGAEIGIYYMNNSATFTIYNTNLPNTSVRDLEIYYPSLKLRAATYGRGVWESPLNETSVEITASAGANGRISPTGTVSVITGTNHTFTITPSPCYSIATVLVNGVNNPAAVSSGTYTFINVTTPQTISVTFVATAPFVIATPCIPTALPINIGNFLVGPTKVILGNINNVSSSSTSDNGNQAYYDYTSVYCQTGFSTNLNVSSNPQSITFSCTVQNNQKFTAWIDYNNDGNFTTNEIIVNNQIVPKDIDTSFTFSIPNTGVTLNTPLRMRVIGDINTNTSSAPCGQRNYGQVEDYQVTVLGVITTTTWTGAVDTSWANAGNWTSGVPTATIEATINAVTNLPVISAAATTKKLTVNASASVTVTSTNSLTVVENIVNNGTITIQNNASLLQTNDVVNSGSGNTIVNRNSASIMRQDYTMWSSPVNGAQTLRQFSPNTVTSPVRFNKYNPLTSPDGFFEPLSIAEIDASFQIAKGYLIRVDNNHPAIATIWNGVFNGSPNNGSLTATVTPKSVGVTQGFNAIGNPYPSDLNLTTFFAANTNLTGSAYLWRKTNGAVNGYGYCTWANGVWTTNSSSAIAPPNNNTISVGQGFLVQVNSGTQVVFNNSMRTNNATDHFLRNANAPLNEQHSIWLNLNDNLGSFSQSAVVYATGSTNNYDQGKDAKLLNDINFSIYSLINGENYTIQSRTLPFTDADIIPLGYKVQNNGNYSISIDHTNGLFAAGQTVYLKDLDNNITHNLETPYNFTSLIGSFNNRFQLVYTSTLSNNNNDLNSNSIIVFKDVNDNIEINSTNIDIENVKVFDLLGRLLVEKKDLNSKSVTINDLNCKDQMVLVEIMTKNNGIITKKIYL